MKSCQCYYSMSFLWQCMKIISVKYLTETCISLSLFLSVSLSICLSVYLPVLFVCLSLCLPVCLCISLLKPEPIGPELPKFGPAWLRPKPRPVRAQACSLFSKSLSSSPTFGLRLRPDPALVMFFKNFRFLT